MSTAAVRLALLTGVLLAVGLPAAENAGILFQRDKEEILRLAGDCGLDDHASIASVETASGRQYLLAFASIRTVGVEAPAPGQARTIAHAKALRAITAFRKTEVQAEESLTQITTVRGGAEGSEKRIERVRAETIRLRASGHISQAYVLVSRVNEAAGTHELMLALRLGPP
jgi:hypothetical protein